MFEIYPTTFQPTSLNHYEASTWGGISAHASFAKPASSSMDRTHQPDDNTTSYKLLLTNDQCSECACAAKYLLMNGVENWTSRRPPTKRCVFHSSADILLGTNGNLLHNIQRDFVCRIKVGKLDEAPAMYGGMRVTLVRGRRNDVRAALGAILDVVGDEHAARGDSSTGSLPIGSPWGHAWQLQSPLPPPEILSTTNESGVLETRPHTMSPRAREHSASIASHDSATSAGSGSVAGRSPVGSAHNTKLLQCAVRALIPEQASGAVLGRGGSTSRSITQMTGATIKLSAVDYPGRQKWLDGGERVVSCIGPQHSVTAAALAVFDILAAESRK